MVRAIIGTRVLVDGRKNSQMLGGVREVVVVFWQHPEKRSPATGCWERAGTFLASD